METTQNIHTLVIKHRKGKKTQTDTYRFINEVPLRDGKKALKVNWCELISTDDFDRVIYQNSFGINNFITQYNVTDIVKVGRARWKIYCTRAQF